MLMMLLHQGICFYYSLLCFNPFLCIIVYFANRFGEFLQSVVRGELRAHFLKLLVLTKFVTPINFPSIINRQLICYPYFTNIMSILLSAGHFY